MAETVRPAKPELLIASHSQSAATDMTRNKQQREPGVPHLATGDKVQGKQAQLPKAQGRISVHAQGVLKVSFFQVKGSPNMDLYLNLAV